MQWSVSIHPDSATPPGHPICMVMNTKAVLHIQIGHHLFLSGLSQLNVNQDFTMKPPVLRVAYTATALTCMEFPDTLVRIIEQPCSHSTPTPTKYLPRVCLQTFFIVQIQWPSTSPLHPSSLYSDSDHC